MKKTFRHDCPGAFMWAKRSGMFNDICEHMNIIKAEKRNKKKEPLTKKTCFYDNCNVLFQPYDSKQKYCSIKCRTRKLADKNRKTNKKPTEQMNSNRSRDFPGADVSYSIKKGKEDMKKIMECSVDCLLNELGELE